LTGRKIVYDAYGGTFGNEPSYEMGADETSAASN
jgi:S-adenosylmethionine synthetase